MQGDTLTAALFFGGSGIAMVIAAITQAGWKHKLLIWGLLGVGALFCAVSLFWPLLSSLSPKFTAFVISISTTPSSWFTLLMFCVAVALLAPSKRQPGGFLPLAGSGDPQISTSALMGDLNGQIGQLNQKVETNRTAAEARSKNLVEVMAETNVELEGAIKRDLQNAEDARLAQIKLISEETQHCSERIKSLEGDVHRLVFFATDLATLAVLEAQIDEGSRLTVPLEADVELATRNEKSAKAEGFIRRVQSTYAQNHRGMEVNGILHNAENEAERELNDTPPHQRPTYIDVLDYRRLKIAEMRRMRLVAFLLYQRDEKKAEIRRQRPDLADRLPSDDKS